MAVLISGSLAFDVLMRCKGRFADHLLPDRLDRLDVSFQAHTLRREFGGCAGNIAYAMRLLGGDPWPMAVLGADGEPYWQRLESLGISTRFVRRVPEAMTAQAMVLTDADHNQITTFHPGAMAVPWPAPEPAPDVALACVSPDEREVMLAQTQRLHAAGIPFLFDPGQALPLLDAESLRAMVGMASWIAVNAYEGRMLLARLGLDAAALSRRVRGLMLTRGAEGCEVWVDGQGRSVPPVPVAAVVDPTGCGDAFRGGLLHGLLQGWNLTRCAALGNRMGAAKVQSLGAQNYGIDRRAVLAGLE